MARKRSQDLVKETQAGVKCGATPSLNGPIANLVHLGKDGQHIANLHTGGPEGLLTVTDGGVHDVQRLHRSPSYLFHGNALSARLVSKLK